MTDISQFSGWVAIAYLIIKDVLIPIFRKTVPVKIKNESEQIKHALAMDEKKIISEIATQERLTKSIEELAKNAITQTELSRVQNDRMSIMESDIKDIKQVVVPRRVKKAN